MPNSLTLGRNFESSDTTVGIIGGAAVVSHISGGTEGTRPLATGFSLAAGILDLLMNTDKHVGHPAL